MCVYVYVHVNVHAFFGHDIIQQASIYSLLLLYEKAKVMMNKFDESDTFVYHRCILILDEYICLIKMQENQQMQLAVSLHLM